MNEWGFFFEETTASSLVAAAPALTARGEAFGPLVPIGLLVGIALLASLLVTRNRRRDDRATGHGGSSDALAGTNSLQMI